MILDILEYYNMIKNLNINIIYSGPIWADGIEGIAETVKKRLAFDELPLSSSQSVFSVFAEQMNNVLMYSAEKVAYGTADENQTLVSKGVFVLGVKDGEYFIQSGNVVKNSSIGLIKNKIDYLNTLDKQELRKYYKKKIKSDEVDPESKGAGLGLIEIARRSDSKIEYAFTPMEDGSTFFAMSVTIGRSGDRKWPIT